MPVRTLILAAILLTPASVLADKLGPNINPENQPAAEKPELSTKMQALLDGISTPEAALEKSREYQQNGQFGLAKVTLLHGIELAKTSGDEFTALTDELDYAMPLLQAKELLVMGKPDEADLILESLAKKFSSNQSRTDEISSLRGALTQSRFLAAAKRNNEQEVTRDVRKRMSAYYREHGSFPNYTELNQLLPANDKVLQNYEIVYFKSVPNAYRMVLRNLHNKENLLKIEATGLIK
ncbi:MAG: hypothetical protein ACN4GR_04405 [Arenicellales bacterium]